MAVSSSRGPKRKCRNGKFLCVMFWFTGKESVALSRFRKGGENITQTSGSRIIRKRENMESRGAIGITVIEVNEKGGSYFDNLVAEALAY